MPRRRKVSYWAKAWNAGTAVNVLLIPVITFIFFAGGALAVSKYKFDTYDVAAADVRLIQIHNASQDEQVKQIQTLLIVLSSKVDALRNNTPISGPGSGGGPAVGGSSRQEP